MSRSERPASLEPADLVVCLPVALFHDWYDEGGTPDWADDNEYTWEIGSQPPGSIQTNHSRLSIVCAGVLRGFAPIRRVEQVAGRRWALIRDGRSAEAVTIPEQIKSFRGWRYRWWDHEDERPFDEWAWEAVPPRPS